jgi:hypothetical protein
MPCLPLMSFSSSISSVLRPSDPPIRSGLSENEHPIPILTPNSPTGFESPYDKLSRMSVSHRRNDSFEWVTQSAPNTPPTLGEASYEPYTPPPARLIGSAPLPVPNESWTGVPSPHEEKGQRRLFDWWSLPSFSNDKGYAKIPIYEEWGQHDAHTSNEATDESSAAPPKALAPQEQKAPALDARSARLTSLRENNQLRPSEELNALGILFLSTPPPSPSGLTISKPALPFVSPHISSRVPAPRLPKRVSFSPVIDEVISEPFPDFTPPEQQSLTWGSYLPSSFLVARPPLPRTTSLPMSRGKTIIRPILRRSTSQNDYPSYHSRLNCPLAGSTEMIRLSPQSIEKSTAPYDVAEPSPMPTQRLSASALRSHRQRCIDQSTEEADRAFVSLLEVAQKPARRRCDSMLSTTSSNTSEEYRSLRPSTAFVNAQSGM